MNLSVNQDNLYLFLPSKICWITDMLMDDRRMNLVEAIKQIYASATYQRMEDESTKMWHLGPTSLYLDLKEELSRNEE